MPTFSRSISPEELEANGLPVGSANWARLRGVFRWAVMSGRRTTFFKPDYVDWALRFLAPALRHAARVVAAVVDLLLLPLMVALAAAATLSRFFRSSDLPIVESRQVIQLRPVHPGAPSPALRLI